jgi:hypothetical protein
MIGMLLHLFKVKVSKTPFVGTIQTFLSFKFIIRNRLSLQIIF